MSNFTTQVRWICESSIGINSTNKIPTIDEALEAGYREIFDFDFPLFDPDYRRELCIKILKHYYVNEICCETIGLWKLMLNSRLNDIMPYYNQLYKIARLDFNPLYDTEYMRTGNIVDDGSNSSTTKQLYQNTPQGNINILDDEHYITDVNKNLNTGKNDLTRDYWEKITGRTGTSASKLILEYRKAILNIDKMIIEDLKDLFFGLWE